MKKLLTLATAIIFVTLGKCDTLPESGDRVLIGDFEYVLVRAGDWERVTNDVATCVATWAKLNGTEAGRTSLHGRRGNTSITNGEVRVTYADGYTHAEPVRERAIANQRNPETTAKPSRRIDEMRKRRREIMANPRVLTIEEEAGK